MDRVIPSTYYTLNAAAQTITLLPPYNTLTAENIASIRNISKQIEIYNSEDPRKHTLFIKESDRTQEFDIEITDGILTYVEDAGISNGDTLRIIFDGEVIPIIVNVVNPVTPPLTAAPLITSSLVFTADDVLTTEKKTSALTLSSVSSSGNYVLSVTKPVENTAGDLILKIYNQISPDGVNLTDQYVMSLVVEKITGFATNRSFIVSGIGIGEGTIKVGGYFATDSGAITVNFTVHPINTVDSPIPTTALTSGSLSYAIGEGLTEKKTAALSLSEASPSGNYLLSVSKPVENTTGDLTLKIYNQVKTDGVNTTDQLVTIRTVEKITGSATNRCYALYGLGIGNGTVKVGGIFTANCAAATTVSFVINAM
jgi:hypothetical protein